MHNAANELVAKGTFAGVIKNAAPKQSLNG
jgi:hypothetical protein